ncbi:uncharacterized protein COLE_04107 [Cutaneotrichosporon oleaginosum]|uniref:uncharacterized protein n=1 Tax=Cutaneotrichosporon oleaginosum TaxID=879819 RepID=UPI00132C7004|nr:hypothetical protein COLE_04107 [Cutaneotrichosporon oleaginosum]
MEKEDTPDVKPRVSGSAEAAHRAAPEEAEEHAAEAAVEAALGSTPREASAPASAPAPAPSRVNLADISSLISELVRNREEKVAIAVGAYNAIDRHIRALDSALSAHETSVLGFETPKPAGRSVSVMSEGVPPGIEADPNEPRYCYCNQVSYGEMVGCDNDDCPMEWFHLACLGMSQPPAGQWLCDVCRKDRKEGGGRRGRGAQEAQEAMSEAGSVV